MKLTVKQLRTIIKEEVESAMTQAAAPKKPANKKPAPAAPPVEETGDWKKSDPEWVALKKHLGPKEYRRRYTGPESFVQSGWKASWAADEYDAAFEAWRDVLDSYSEMVGEFSLNGEDSEEYAAAAADNDAAVKAFAAAEADWERTARPRMRASAPSRGNPSDAWDRVGRPAGNLLPSTAGGPLYHDRGEPTAADRDNMSWSGTKEWNRYVQRRERTPEEHDSWLYGGGK